MCIRDRVLSGESKERTPRTFRIVCLKHDRSWTKYKTSEILHYLKSRGSTKTESIERHHEHLTGRFKPCAPTTPEFLLQFLYFLCNHYNHPSHYVNIAPYTTMYLNLNTRQANKLKWTIFYGIVNCCYSCIRLTNNLTTRYTVIKRKNFVWVFILFAKSILGLVVMLSLIHI